MATRNALEVAKREMLASLGQLPPDARFAVVFYNLRSTTLADPQGHRGLMAATQGNKARVRAQLAEIEPVGGTDHMLALCAALALHPEVVFFLTDADLMTNSDVTEILSEAGSTRIQAVEFGRGPPLGSSALSRGWRRPPAARTATSTSRGSRRRAEPVAHLGLTLARISPTIAARDGARPSSMPPPRPAVPTRIASTRSS